MQALPPSRKKIKNAENPPYRVTVVVLPNQSGDDHHRSDRVGGDNRNGARYVFDDHPPVDDLSRLGASKTHQEGPHEQDQKQHELYIKGGKRCWHHASGSDASVETSNGDQEGHRPLPASSVAVETASVRGGGGVYSWKRMS